MAIEQIKSNDRRKKKMKKNIHGKGAENYLIYSLELNDEECL